MQIRILRTNSTPVYMQVKNHFKKLIVSGELLVGFRLPSIRELAADLGIHRNTIAKAYSLLKEEGFIESKSGHYYEVLFRPQAKRRADSKHMCTLHWESLLKEPYLKHEQLFDTLVRKSTNGSYISFAADFSYHRDAPQIVQKLLFEVSQQPILQDSFGYTPTGGLPSLRKSISEMLHGRHIYAAPSEVQIFTEATQTLNYLIKLFIAPDDYVIIEEPFYTDVYQILSEEGARIVTVPQDRDGMKTDILEVMAEKYRPKMIYTIPTFNNPTRTVMSLARRYELLDISARYRIPVVEEETCYDLRFEGKPVPPIKALDTRGHVIYIDSFTDTFSPGIRVSYAVAPKPVTEKFKHLVAHDSMQMDTVSQIIMAEFLTRGYYAENVKRIIKILRKKRSLMMAELDKAADIPISYTRPEGGLGIWCRVPDFVNLAKLQKEMEKQGVLFMPGYLFYGNLAKAENYIRLNFGYPSEEDIKKGMPILVEGIRKYAKY